MPKKAAVKTKKANVTVKLKKAVAKTKPKTAVKKELKKADKPKIEKTKVNKKEVEKPKNQKSIKEKKKVIEERIAQIEGLVSTDDYLSTGIHIGTKHKTKFMDKYVYKVRSDGLSILNIELIDKRIKEVSDLINKYKPEEVLIASRREIGIKPLKLLNKATGIRISTDRYLPGTLTNPNYKDFFEPKIVIITDIWNDKTVVMDALKTGAVIIALLNTNNNADNIDIAIPCNNKGKKSVALIYWILAREYCKANKLKFDYSLEDFF